MIGRRNNDGVSLGLVNMKYTLFAMKRCKQRFNIVGSVSMDMAKCGEERSNDVMSLGLVDMKYMLFTMRRM